MTTTVEFGPWADRLAEPAGVLRDLTSKVREDTDHYVPYREGNLASDSLSIIEPGGETNTLVYGAPYAHYLFVGEVMAGTKPRKSTGEALHYFQSKGHEHAGPDWIGRAAEANMSTWEQEALRGLLR